MLGKLLRREETSAALVLALSGTTMMLVANGSGPISLRRIASGVLSNPVPQQARPTARGSGVSLQRVAA